MVHRLHVPPTMTHWPMLGSTMMHRSRVVYGSLLRKRTAEDVPVRVRARVEQRKHHEHHKHRRTHNRERYVMEKKATTLFRRRAKRLIRKSRGGSGTHFCRTP